MWLSKVLKNPYCIFSVLAARGYFSWLPDKLYVNLMFRSQMGKWPNLKTPKTFNEKLQWLKLYDRRPEYAMMADKYRVREYISNTLGEEHLIPMLGVWNTPEEIDFDSLPNSFVLKCNHNSGLGMCICRDKTKVDEKKVKKDLQRGLNQNYYITGREWCYKNIDRRIVAEQYMEDCETRELRDYKFFCFNGKVKCFKIDYDRFINHRANYYSPQGELLRFGEVLYPPDFERELAMPHTLEKMVSFAEKLSKGIPFLRVDFYEVNNEVYFGELTFYPFAGFGVFEPEEWDSIFGEWLQLP